MTTPRPLQLAIRTVRTVVGTLGTVAVVYPQDRLMAVLAEVIRGWRAIGAALFAWFPLEVPSSVSDMLLLFSVAGAIFAVAAYTDEGTVPMQRGKPGEPRHYLLLGGSVGLGAPIIWLGMSLLLGRVAPIGWGVRLMVAMWLALLLGALARRAAVLVLTGTITIVVVNELYRFFGAT